MKLRLKTLLCGCLLACWVVCPEAVAAEARLDSLLSVLDDVILHSRQFEVEKERHIASIRQSLSARALSPEEEYAVNFHLHDEYETYICDSALHYINRNIEIAGMLGRNDWLVESKLKKAHLLAVSGLYAEGIALLQTIDRKDIVGSRLLDYYTAYENIYLYHAEYAQDDEYRPHYLKLRACYLDSILHIVPPGTYMHAVVQAPLLIDQGRYEEARSVLRHFLPQLNRQTRDYAVLTSVLAFACEPDRPVSERKYYLAESAIADIRCVVKENNSLRVLAELLYEEGDLERANRYMKKSMADATFYNARLRNIQASRMLPLIDNAYQREKEAQRQKLYVSLWVISALSLFLIAAVIFVIGQMKKLARARREVVEANRELQKLNEDLTAANLRQQEMNGSLTEANCVKEEYIGRFLGLCSAYIDKWETYRKMLNKQAGAGKLDELYKQLKSSRFIDEALKDFYREFDNAFLNIYPHFVESFNRLFPPEEQVEPKQGERLSTELRIYALIRLGISDSSRIASFLRCSITTIYTYRSKLKNKSLYRGNFEAEVMKIGIPKG
ncbi:DUF6377 domain-containing protein [Mediterranea massiliensis]|uniref:DUF6377 domain-containing protein n=1 Tax=Mediterranea massiliensis TaxID=1841865 RepID=UPI0025A3CB54|nr:DUF6377 domain-containing protein [Mediterranea massiliensis]MDM8336383.1 DUF6377 domain-containing protein [Mediterranea massiliensis]